MAVGRAPWPATSGVQTAVLQVPLAAPHPVRSDKPASAIPAQSDAALRQAMTLEGVPGSWQDGLRFIIAHESGGVVDIRNPVRSARGLFQLTAANYHLNLAAAGPLDLRFDIINVGDEKYEIRDGTGIGVGAPQFGPRRGFFAGVTKSF